MKVTKIAFFLILTAIATIATAQRIIRVSPIGNGNGSSWSNAADLERALDTAKNEVCHIWLLEGTYRPAQTLVIPQSTHIYGGFRATDTLFYQRNYATRESVLDGLNSFGVVLLGKDAVLNGVTVQNGRAASSTRRSGGGVWMQTSSRIENCKILNNTAMNYGGAIYAEGNNLIYNTLIKGNESGGSGSAIYGSDNVEVRGNTITENIQKPCTPAKDTTIINICTGETATLTYTDTIPAYSFLWSNGANTSTITTPALNTTTVYDVIVTSTEGCTFERDFKVVVNEFPTVRVSADMSTANPGISVLFSAIGSPLGGSYRWMRSSSDTATLARSSTFIATMRDAGDLQFLCMYTLNGCGASDWVNVKNSNCTPPTVPSSIQATKTGICQGDSVTLTLVGGLRNSGTWKLLKDSCTGTLLDQSMETTPSFKVIPNATTRYFILGEGCGQKTACVSVTITVHPKTPAITGRSEVCLYDTLHLSCGSGGTWSALNAFTTVDDKGVVTGTGVGSDIITYTDGNGCSSSTNIQVKASPAPIVGEDSICASTSYLYTNSAGGGDWSSSPTNIISTGGNVSSSITGNFTLKYLFSSTGCFAEKNIVVKPRPSISGLAVEVCESDTFTLNASLPGGTWSIAPIRVANFSDLSKPGHFSAIQSGQAIATYTLNKCFDTLPIQVRAKPTSITGMVDICENLTGNARVLPQFSGGTWTSSDPAVATVTKIDSVSARITSVGAGSYDLTYSTPYGCSITQPNLRIHPIPGEITGSRTLGTGATITLSNSVPNGTWSSSDPTVATMDVISGAITGRAVGTTIVRYSLSAGNCSDTFALRVVACPTLSIKSGPMIDTGICYRSTLPNISLNISGATQTEILWEKDGLDLAGSPKGFHYDPNLHILSGTPEESGNFSYIIRTVDHESTCAAASVSRDIRIYDTLQGGTIALDGDSAVCFGQETPHLINVVPGTGGTMLNDNYEWQISKNGTDFEKLEGVITDGYNTLQYDSDRYFRRMRGRTCGQVSSNVIKIVVKPLPAKPNVTIINDYGCGNPTGEIVVNSPLTEPNKTFLLYSLNNGKEIDSTHFVDVRGNTSHILTVRDTISGCLRDTNIYVVLEDTTRLMFDSISSKEGNEFCFTMAGTDLTLTPHYLVRPGAIAYQWTIDGQTGTINPDTTKPVFETTVPNTTETFRLTITNLRTLCSRTQFKTISIRPALDIPYDTITPDIIKCVENVLTKSVDPAENASENTTIARVSVTPMSTVGRNTVNYQWIRRPVSGTDYSIIPGATITYYDVDNTIPSEYVYRCVVQDNDKLCPPDTSKEKTVKILARAKITGLKGDTVCDSGEVRLRATTDGTGIVWYDDKNTKLGTSASDEDFLDTIQTSTSYWAEPVGNLLGCIDSRREVKAIVLPGHRLQIVTNKEQTVCPKTAILPVSVSYTGGATGAISLWKYALDPFSDTITLPNAPKGLVGNESRTVISGRFDTLNTVVSKYWSYITTVGNSCPSKTDTVFFTVRKAPVPVKINGNTTGCDSVVLTVTQDGGGENDTLHWQMSALETSRTTSSANPRTATTSRMYYIRAVSEGCWTDADSANITVNPTSAVTGISLKDSLGTFILTATGGSGTIFWDTLRNSEDISNPGRTYRTRVADTFYARPLSAAGCWGTGRALRVTPCSSFKETDTIELEICNGQSVTLNPNGSEGSTYLWNTGETGETLVKSPDETTVYSAVVSSSDERCIFKANYKVVVHPQPQIVSVFSLEKTACENDTFNIVTSFPGGTWSITPASVAYLTDPTSKPGHVTTRNAGEAKATYTLGKCFDTLSIHVMGTPSFTMTDICEDASGTTNVVAEFAGGEWESSNPSVAKVVKTNDASAQITAVSPGTYDLTYTSSYGCPFTQKGLRINPNPGKITGSRTVGVGVLTTLQNTVAGGTWSSNNSAIATIVPNRGEVTGKVTGSVIITYTLSTGCLDTFAMDVVECPTITRKSGPTTDTGICYRTDIPTISAEISIASETDILWQKGGITTTMPRGLTFDGTTHTLSGTAEESGKFSYFIRAINLETTCPIAYISGNIEVYDSLQGGLIRIANNDTAVCPGEVFSDLVSRISGSGGSRSSSDYEWQISSDGTDFSTIANEEEPGLSHNGQKYDSDRYFRRAWGKTCGQAFSNVIKLTVNPLPDEFNLDLSDDYGCGVPLGEIIVNHPKTNMAYALDAGKWIDSAHLVGVGFGSHTLTVRDTITGCSRDTTITIANTTVGRFEVKDMISSVGDNICATEKGEPMDIAITAFVREGKIVFDWRSNRKVGVIQTDTLIALVSGNVNNTLHTVVPDSTERFTLTLTNLRTGCSRSFDKTITVRQLLELANDTASSTVITCVDNVYSGITPEPVPSPEEAPNANFLNLSVTPPVSREVTYKWQYRDTLGSDYSDITGATSSAYVIDGDVPSAYYYRCVVQDKDKLCPAYTSVEKLVNILAKPEIARVMGDTVCDSGEVHLVAISSTEGTNIVWYDNSGVKLGQTLNKAEFLDTIQANTTYFVEAVSIPSCVGARKEVKAVILPGHSIQITNDSQAVCAQTVLTPINVVYGGGANTLSYTVMRAYEESPGVYGDLEELPGLPDYLQLNSSNKNAVISGKINAVENRNTKYWAFIKSVGDSDICAPVTDTVLVLVHWTPTQPVLSSDPEATNGKVEDCDRLTLEVNQNGENKGTIYWQYSADGTMQTVSENPRTITSDSRMYYIRAVSDFGCWTQADSIDVIVNPHGEITEIIKSRSSGTVTLTAVHSAGDEIHWMYLGDLPTEPIPNGSTCSPEKGKTGDYLAVPYSDKGCPGTGMEIEVTEEDFETCIDQSTTLNICEGESATLSVDNYGSGTYTWGNGSETLLETGSSITVTPSVSDTFTVTVEPNNGDCSSYVETFIVNVLPKPAISGLSEVCEGAEIGLSATLPNGTWSITPSGFADVEQTGRVVGVLKGSAKAIYRLSNSCSDTLDITVKATPKAGSITVAPNICLGVNDSVATIATEFDDGTWSSLASGVASIDLTSGKITTVSAGAYSLKYTTSEGCSFTQTGLRINPVPEAISGSATVGVGVTTTLTNSVSGGTWSSSNPAIATIDALSGVKRRTGYNVLHTHNRWMFNYALDDSCALPNNKSRKWFDKRHQHLSSFRSSKY